MILEDFALLLAAPREEHLAKRVVGRGGFVQGGDLGVTPLFLLTGIWPVFFTLFLGEVIVNNLILKHLNVHQPFLSPTP